MPMPKIAIVLGTRPEIIKMSPIIHRLKHMDYFILHTGQHYSYNMDKIFFEQLDLCIPKYNIDAGSGMHGEQTGKMLIGIEKILLDEQPDIVLVEGDTNSVLAGALAASKIGIKIGHVEAGLRSYDRTMPEEINRILTDHCSDYLFSPTEESKQILLKEGIQKEKIFVTGNTIVDAVYQNLKYFDKAKKADSIKFDEYFLVTIHRQENVDNIDKFNNILIGLKKIKNHFQIPIIYPIHPRSKEMLKKFNISVDWIEVIDPVDYLNFLYLESNAKLILTDSGGVQEESCILKVPCITLRDNTERPETLTVGSNILSGTDPEKIAQCATEMLTRKNGWNNPFGDGNSSSRIVDILMKV
jgi:UDP-N-acetylglucosamine 2-epimerase (non-hydrolysing)